MAERPAPNNLKLVLRMVACVYLLVISVQMAFKVPEAEGVKRYVMIGAIVLFTAFSLAAIIGTVRRMRVMKAQRLREQAEQAAEAAQEADALPEKSVPQPVTEAAEKKAVSVVEEDELPDYFDLEEQMAEIERLAEAGELEQMERLSAKVQRALERQQAEEA